MKSSSDHVLSGSYAQPWPSVTSKMESFATVVNGLLLLQSSPSQVFVGVLVMPLRLIFDTRLTGSREKIWNEIKWINIILQNIILMVEIPSRVLVYPVGIYLLKVNNRNTRTRCEICSKLTIKTPERCLYC